MTERTLALPQPLNQEPPGESSPDGPGGALGQLPRPPLCWRLDGLVLFAGCPGGRRVFSSTSPRVEGTRVSRHQQCPWGATLPQLRASGSGWGQDLREWCQGTEVALVSARCGPLSVQPVGKLVI